MQEIIISEDHIRLEETFASVVGVSASWHIKGKSVVTDLSLGVIGNFYENVYIQQEPITLDETGMFSEYIRCQCSATSTAADIFQEGEFDEDVYRKWEISEPQVGTFTEIISYKELSISEEMEGSATTEFEYTLSTLGNIGSFVEELTLSQGFTELQEGSFAETLNYGYVVTSAQTGSFSEDLTLHEVETTKKFVGSVITDTVWECYYS